MAGAGTRLPPAPISDMERVSEEAEQQMGETERTLVDLRRFRAAILDMDGVITQSARTHLAAWKAMFDEYLQDRAARGGEHHGPFTAEDYYRYVDGKPRYEGARSFLESRDIILPDGSPEDPPGSETVCGLGNRKNEYFRRHLRDYGVDSYPSTIDFVKSVRGGGGRVAAVSSSRNARAVLAAAKVTDLFDVVVDGLDSAERHLKGKPEPDIFLEAARQLNVKPDEAMVIEDALAGVEAGRAGGFALVIGINRSGQNTELKSHGADVVVRDLSELDYRGGGDETIS